METAFLGAILLLRVVQSVSGKSCSKRMPTDFVGIVQYMAMRMGLSAIGAMVLLLAGGGVLAAFQSMSPVGWLVAAGTGVAIALSSVFNLLAMKAASVALGALFSAAGLLVPTIGGIFLYNQSVRLGQWLGILCLLAAAVLLGAASGKTNGKITVRTLLLLLGSTLFNGTTMLLQTIFKMYVPHGSVSAYSFLQFSIPCAALFVMSMVLSRRAPAEKAKTDKELFIFTALAALAVLGISQISTVASAAIPVAVLFPVSDGGGTVISAVVAAVLFKEKLTVKSLLGVLIGIGGLVMIKLLGA